MKWGVFAAIAVLIYGFKLHFDQTPTGTETIVFTDADKNEVVQICDQAGYPVAYYLDVYQYPCIDSVCERMQVRIYWDIWGHFLRLALPPSQPLTKLGHQPFIERDYNRLHKLLNNPRSNVQYYDLAHLTEKESEQAYYSLDGITGATITEVKYETVKGAVKTCYALWHFIYNAALVDNMRTATLQAFVSDTLDVTSENLRPVNEMAQMIKEGVVATGSYLTEKIAVKNNMPSYWACVMELARNTDKLEKTATKALSSKVPVDKCFVNYTLYNYMQQVKIKGKGYKKFEISYVTPVQN